MRLWHEAPTSLEDFDKGLRISDTRQLIRDQINGLIMIDAPAIQMLSGRIAQGQSRSTPSERLKVESTSPEATFIVQSLDGLPIAESQRISLKMVTLAANRNQRLSPSPSPRLPEHLILSAEGTAPIVTSGTHLRDGRQFRMEIPGRATITGAFEGGMLEALVDYDQRVVHLSCDLPGARISLEVMAGGRRPVESYALRAYQHESLTESEPEIVPGLFNYPGWAKMVTLRW